MFSASALQETSLTETMAVFFTRVKEASLGSVSLFGDMAATLRSTQIRDDTTVPAVGDVCCGESLSSEDRQHQTPRGLLQVTRFLQLHMYKIFNIQYEYDK